MRDPRRLPIATLLVVGALAGLPGLAADSANVPRAPGDPIVLSSALEAVPPTGAVMVPTGAVVVPTDAIVVPTGAIVVPTGAVAASGRRRTIRAQAVAARGQAVAARAQAVAAQGPAAGELLGFDRGEERRYRLGPLEALLRGEEAVWTILLQELDDEAGTGTFRLGHEWSAPTTLSAPPVGTVTSISSEATVKVNRHGFPLEVRLESTRRLYGLGDQAHTVRYVFQPDGERFRKIASADGRTWEDDPRIRDAEGLDLETPAGLFVLVGRGVDCYEEGRPPAGPLTSPAASSSPGRPPVLPPPPGLVTPRRGASGAANVYHPWPQCHDPVFAHPGLLGLAVAGLLEGADEELRVQTFMPVGALARPGWENTTRVGGGVTGAGGRRSASAASTAGPGSPGETVVAAANRLSNYYRELRVWRDDLQEIDVGSRRLDAVRLETDQAFFPVVWVDPSGRVLRVDHERLGRQVRLLFATEY